MKAPRADIIADLHQWPSAGIGNHMLDRDCYCKPLIKQDSKAPNSFLVIHQD